MSIPSEIIKYISNKIIISFDAKMSQQLNKAMRNVRTASDIEAKCQSITKQRGMEKESGSRIFCADYSNGVHLCCKQNPIICHEE